MNSQIISVILNKNQVQTINNIYQKTYPVNKINVFNYFNNPLSNKGDLLKQKIISLVKDTSKATRNTLLKQFIESIINYQYQRAQVISRQFDQQIQVDLRLLISIYFDMSIPLNQADQFIEYLQLISMRSSSIQSIQSKFNNLKQIYRDNLRKIHIQFLRLKNIQNNNQSSLINGMKDITSLEKDMRMKNIRKQNDEKQMKLKIQKLLKSQQQLKQRNIMLSTKYNQQYNISQRLKSQLQDLKKQTQQAMNNLDKQLDLKSQRVNKLVEECQKLKSTINNLRINQKLLNKYKIQSTQLIKQQQSTIKDIQNQKQYYKNNLSQLQIQITTLKAQNQQLSADRLIIKKQDNNPTSKQNIIIQVSSSQKQLIQQLKNECIYKTQVIKNLEDIIKNNEIKHQSQIKNIQEQLYKQQKI